MNVTGFITVFFIISNANVKTKLNYKDLREHGIQNERQHEFFLKNRSIEITNSRNPQSTPIASL